MLFWLKYKSREVTNTPPSYPSTLNVCDSGFGFTNISVLLSTNCTPSFDLKYEGWVETIDRGLSGFNPVE